MQRSFIKQKLSDDLQIQHKGTEDLNLATFGVSSKTLRRVPTDPEKQWKKNNSNRCIDSANQGSTVVQHAIESHKLEIPKRIETDTSSNTGR